MVAISHVQSITIGDFTGTITVFNSAGSTTTANATDIVKPSGWNSVHQLAATISGNTLGASSTLSGATNVVLAGGSNVSLSLNTGASAATISIIAGGGILSRYTDWGLDGASSASQITLGSASIKGFIIPEDVSFSRVDVPIFLSLTSSATANTFGMAVSSGLIIYTRNVSTLSPIIGSLGNTTYTVASTSNVNSVTGARYVSFPLATKLSAGEYFAAFQMSTNTFSSGTATTSLGNTISGFFQNFNNSLFADFGVLTAASTNMVIAGLFSTTISNTTQTLGMSTMTLSGTAQLRANFPIIFRNW
jgi:hypothetical protein